MVRSLALVLLFTAGGTSGCKFDEKLPIYDLQGQVRIPKSAVTQTVVEEDGSTSEFTDVRMIGPVYVGLYAALQDEGANGYPYPEQGPAFGENEADTYPYGGTSVGDLRYACFEYFQCRMVSGRYIDFDDILDWFNNYLDEPVLDAFGNTVTTGDFIRQTCYELLDVTTDAELRITATDRNEDGFVDENDLDFVEDGDDFVADFTIWQQDFYEGMTAWAFLDSPAPSVYTFDTCNADLGFQENEYNRDFRAGTQEVDILNVPSNYLVPGDYVASTGFIWNDPTEIAEITIDLVVER
jgi:hypothetical protein